MTIHYRVIAETRKRGMHYLTPDGLQDTCKLWDDLDQAINAMHTYLRQEDVEIISIGRVVKCQTLKN